MQETKLSPNHNDTTIQMVVFTTGDQSFCVHIDSVSEIIKRDNITELPKSPQFVAGVINFRGEVITAVDIRKLFNLTQDPSKESKHIVVVRVSEIIFGLVVDEVVEVVHVQTKDLKAKPTVSDKIQQQFIKGIVSSSERLIIYLDLYKILLHNQLLPTKNSRYKETQGSL